MKTGLTLEIEKKSIYHPMLIGKTTLKYILIQLLNHFDMDPMLSLLSLKEGLEFADLLSKATQSRLPTLLTNYSILVTNNSESCFAVDSVLITEADVFVDTFIAIDFIASPLDFETYGQLWLASSRRSLLFQARVLKWAKNFSITFWRLKPLLHGLWSKAGPDEEICDDVDALNGEKIPSLETLKNTSMNN
ncbi:hypothetical protein YC2023_032398 [Brassica napus]